MSTAMGWRALFLLAGALGSIAPSAAVAREASHIRLFMESLAPGDDRGQLRSDLEPDRAVLRVQVSRLEPSLEHVLLGDGLEVARFTTNAAGSAELRLDLFATGDGTTPAFDPRGKRLTVSDGTNELLEAWVYADPADDPARPRIKEQTRLARVNATEGSVEARYDALPSGGARFKLDLRGVAPGDYAVLVEGAEIAMLTPNAGGSARLDLRVMPGNGNARGRGRSNGRTPHNVRGPLTIDPRCRSIELVQDGVVQFAGPMQAQIPGLGVCTPSLESAPPTPDPAQTSDAETASLAIE